VRRIIARQYVMIGNKTVKLNWPEISDLTVEEPDAEGEGFDAEELMDDDDVVVCAIPRDEGSDD
jgi:hypothetical protein